MVRQVGVGNIKLMLFLRKNDLSFTFKNYNLSYKMTLIHEIYNILDRRIIEDTLQSV